MSASDKIKYKPGIDYMFHHTSVGNGTYVLTSKTTSGLTLMTNPAMSIVLFSTGLVISSLTTIRISIPKTSSSTKYTAEFSCTSNELNSIILDKNINAGESITIARILSTSIPYLSSSILNAISNIEHYSYSVQLSRLSSGKYTYTVTVQLQFWALCSSAMYITLSHYGIGVFGI